MEKRMSQLIWLALILLSILVIGMFFAILALWRQQNTDQKVDMEIARTEVAETIVAAMTDTALVVSSTSTSTPTKVLSTEIFVSTPTKTATVLPTPTPTTTPEPTHTPLPTDIPTLTPSPTLFLPPCDMAEFVKDVVIEDRTALTPNTEFIKTWRIKNVGSCIWTTDYAVVYSSGDRLGDFIERKLLHDVYPGEMIDISVPLVSPTEEGDYQSFWLLKNSSGETFGVGGLADQPFWVEIEVLKPQKQFAFDFTANYCVAFWVSSVGDLSCQGDTSDNKGFVIFLDNPVFEGGRQENEPVLWLHTPEEDMGWIRGKYPPFIIEDGDHFLSYVGCLDGFQSCDLRFRLTYQIDNSLEYVLGEWFETFDGNITQIDLDISDLSGEEVQFILSMEAISSPDNAQGFWFGARIDRDEEGE